jgi:hypothetical protein
MKKTLLFGLMTFLSACSLFYTPDSGVPAYIHVPEFTLTTNYAEQGTASHNIRDVWVFIDGDVEGVYQLPVTFPILREGPQRLQLSAGILVNGIAATRAIYPFYSQYDTTLQLKRGRTDTIFPATQYNQQITFAWMEDFESQGFSLRTTNLSDTSFLLRSALGNDEVFEGVGAMGFAVDSRAPFFAAETIQLFSFPGGGGRAIFLELNYRNNQPFEVGLQFVEIDGQFIDLPIITLAPSGTNWRKQYINFTPYVQGRTGVRYRVIFRAAKSEEVAVGRVFVDNLKLIW